MDPPDDSKVGEKVYVEGYQHDVAGGILHYMYILLQHRVLHHQALGRWGRTAATLYD